MKRSLIANIACGIITLAVLFMLCVTVASAIHTARAEVAASIAPTEPAILDPAQLQPPDAGESALPSSFSWVYLASTGGAATLIAFVAQFIKAPLDKVWKIPTRLLVYILCLATLLVANAFIGNGLTVEKVILSVFNAFISAFAAYGAYEVWFRKHEKPTA